METITLADYIQYGFLAFIGLLLVAMLVALLRQGRDIGELKGELRGTNRRIDDVNGNLSDRIDAVNSSLSDRIESVNNHLSDRIDNLSTRMDRLEDRMERLEATVASQGREISEVKGLVISLHERVDLMMRHRHDPDDGQVLLTPEEVAAD